MNVLLKKCAYFQINATQFEIVLMQRNSYVLNTFLNEMWLHSRFRIQKWLCWHYKSTLHVERNGHELISVHKNGFCWFPEWHKAEKQVIGDRERPTQRQRRQTVWRREAGFLRSRGRADGWAQEPDDTASRLGSAAYPFSGWRERESEGRTWSLIRNQSQHTNALSSIYLYYSKGQKTNQNTIIGTILSKKYNRGQATISLAYSDYRHKV